MSRPIGKHRKIALNMEQSSRIVTFRGKTQARCYRRAFGKATRMLFYLPLCKGGIEGDLPWVICLATASLFKEGTH